MSAISASSSTSVADAAGKATAQIGPVPIGQTWSIARTSVTSDSVLRSTATLYRGIVSPANLIDQTPGGGNADTSGIGYRLRPGESATVQWTGCTVGARCSFSIEGETE